MRSMDHFIQQLIQSGLAVSFLTAVKKHYLKINEVYNILYFLEEENIESFNCLIDDYENLTVEVFLKKEVEKEFDTSSEIFDIQANNYGNMISITVSNLNGNEDDIYEVRLARCEKSHNNKWS